MVADRALNYPKPSVACVDVLPVILEWGEKRGDANEMVSCSQQRTSGLHERPRMICTLYVVEE